MSFYDALLFSKGQRGERGYSAYEIAVQNGYEGTEEEWANSFLSPTGYYTKAETDNKLKKKAYYFDNVASMKSATNLKDGDFVITLGYYDENDGGGAKYRIVRNTTRYSENLSNGLKAEIILDNIKIYNVKQFGIKSGVNESQNDKLDELISIMTNGDTLYFPNGLYRFDRQIKLLHRINLIGDNFSTGERDENFNGSRLEFIISENVNEPYALIDCSYNNKTLIKNIYVNSNSYEISCDRNLQSENATPVDCFTTNIVTPNIVGIKLHNYGSTLKNVIVKGCSRFAVDVGFFNLLEDVFVYQSSAAFHLYNDNVMNNCKCFTCESGINIEGSINLINNFRADEIRGYGVLAINTEGNNINSITIDYAQKGAIRLENCKDSYITGKIGRVGSYYAQKGLGVPGESCYILLIGCKNNRIDIIASESNTTDYGEAINNPCYKIVTRGICLNNRYVLTGKIINITNNKKLTVNELKELILIEYGSISDILEYGAFIYQFDSTNNSYDMNTIYSNEVNSFKYSGNFIKKISSFENDNISFNLNATAGTQTYLIIVSKNRTADRGLYLVGFSEYTQTFFQKAIIELSGVTIMTDVSNKKITVGGLNSYSSIQVISNVDFIVD